MKKPCFLVTWSHLGSWGTTLSCHPQVPWLMGSQWEFPWVITGLGGKYPWSKPLGISPRDLFGLTRDFFTRRLVLDPSKNLDLHDCPGRKGNGTKWWLRNTVQNIHQALAIFGPATTWELCDPSFFSCPDYKKCMVLQMIFLVLKRSCSDCHMWYHVIPEGEPKNFTTAYRMGPPSYKWVYKPL